MTEIQEASLRQRIEDKIATIGVVGLGYVGLTVACKFAQAGFRVVGVDVKSERVESINAGRLPMEGNEPGLADLLATVVANGCFRATIKHDDLGVADVAVVAVETPIGPDHEPRYGALTAALRELKRVLRPKALVVIESTIAPGTMDRVVRPALEPEATHLLLGHCPERVMPGKLLTNLESMSRVCGGSTPEIASIMRVLYRHITRGDLDPTDCVTAELVKTAENAYRDINIAFANELALICEVVGGDVWKVRELVNKSPDRQVLLPGPGVGGHCIPKDPWLLAYGSGDDVDPCLIRAARKVNDRMPLHVVDLLTDALRMHELSLSNAKVAVLGYAYLEDSDDTRNSPSEAVVSRLRELGAEVAVHDPWVTRYKADVLEVLKGCHAAVAMVAHRAYREIDLFALKSALANPILIDTRRMFSPAQAAQAGLLYFCVGRSAIL